ncbi:MAG: DUF3293 domain-containing protein [Xanthomonadaceae bacterium]|nr:DUF3293 domain-containing protein [Xanthomonadaceae bacterium]
MSYGPSPERIAHLATSYLAADYRWELDGVWLRLAIGQLAPEVDTAFPDAGRFGLMTAANPGQHMRADIDNRSADRALQRRMDELGLRYRPAFVSAPNRVWRAYNWLLVAPDVDAFDTLARDFGQIGTLLWSRGTPVRLRMQASAPRACAGTAWVDWSDPIGARAAGHADTEAKSARSP